MNTQATKPKKLAFALAGRVVSNSTVARKILRDAITDDKQYLIPQARSVLGILARAGQ